jgi:hypothetical protein
MGGIWGKITQMKQRWKLSPGGNYRLLAFFGEKGDNFHRAIISTGE